MNLKNTPWETDCLEEGANWIIVDSKGNVLFTANDKETAHTIASLPQLR